MPGGKKINLPNDSHPNLCHNHTFCGLCWFKPFVFGVVHCCSLEFHPRKFWFLAPYRIILLADTAFVRGIFLSTGISFQYVEVHCRETLLPLALPHTIIIADTDCICLEFSCLLKLHPGEFKFIAVRPPHIIMF